MSASKRQRTSPEEQSGGKRSSKGSGKGGGKGALIKVEAKWKCLLPLGLKPWDGLRVTNHGTNVLRNVITYVLKI